MYNPPERFDTAMILLVPTWERAQGKEIKKYPPLENGAIFHGSFRTFGGTERDVNGIYTIVNTAIVETWYRPDIVCGCRIALDCKELYEIIGDPEDINRRHQYLKFKVQRVKGGA